MPNRRTEPLVLDLTQEQQITIMRALGVSARVLEIPAGGPMTIPFGVGSVPPGVGTRKLALTDWQKAEIRDRMRQSFDYIELTPGLSAFR